jgi:hypothetical protein
VDSARACRDALKEWMLSSDVPQLPRPVQKAEPPLVAPADSAPRTDTERKLAALLKQQAELATDITPEGEQRYQAIVAALESSSREAEAARTSPRSARNISQPKKV